MSKTVLPTLSALLISSLALTAWGEEGHSVGQEDKAFTKEKLTIKVGETVKFVNNDPFFHNVFSLSDTKVFDLGSFPEGEHRTVTFEKPGVVEVECAIHPSMTMTIDVQE